MCGIKSCKGCPINITTEEGEKNSQYCLPSFADAAKWQEDTGKVWACHANPKKACGGFLIRMQHYGAPIEITPETILITEETTLEEIYDGREEI